MAGDPNGGPVDLGFDDPYLEGDDRFRKPPPGGGAAHDYYLQDKANPYRHFRNHDKRQWEEAQRADAYVQQARQAAVGQAQLQGQQGMGMAQSQALGMANSYGSSPLAQRRAAMGMATMGGEAAVKAGAARMGADLGADEMALAAWQRRMAALNEMQRAQVGIERTDAQAAQGHAQRTEAQRQLTRQLETQGAKDIAGAAMMGAGAVFGAASN